MRWEKFIKSKIPSGLYELLPDIENIPITHRCHTNRCDKGNLHFASKEYTTKSNREYKHLFMARLKHSQILSRNWSWPKRAKGWTASICNEKKARKLTLQRLSGQSDVDGNTTEFGAGTTDPAVDGKLILFTHPPLPGFASYPDVSYMYHYMVWCFGRLEVRGWRYDGHSPSGLHVTSTSWILIRYNPWLRAGYYSSRWEPNGGKNLVNTAWLLTLHFFVGIGIPS
jgi:hypothetical protein